MSNAIILAYHGPANYASEPFSWFPGNTILSSLSLSSYPTGIIDRTSGVQSRSAWYNLMSNRNNVPPTVEIECTSRTYDPSTRTFNAIFELTALQNLTGEYKYNVIITEDGIVWQQNGSLGGPNYVHDWTVRAMVNGALGQTVVNGAWNQGQTFTMNITNYNLPVPPSPAPDIIPDSCELVCLVYKAGSPLNSNAEIQQAEKWSFVSPDYVGVMKTDQRDQINAINSPAQFSATLFNNGLLADTYYIGLDFEGPANWIQTFTTINGTFQSNEIDSLDLNPGDSTVISVSVDPNSVIGFGQTDLEFWSKNSTSNGGTVEFRLATEGLEILVVDDESDNYENYFTTALNNNSQDYGIVSSGAVVNTTADINTIGSMMWMTGLAEPALDADEINVLGFYLDFGGNLFLNGVDIAYQLADPTSPYYNANTLAFYNNYLHANYIKRNYYTLSVDGMSGDPITDGIYQMKLFGGTGANNLGASSGKYPNEIAPRDTNAATIFKYWYSSGNVAGIRAIHSDGKVVFTTFGFETIADDSNRTKVADKIVNWLLSPVVSIEDPENTQLIQNLELGQNYPNPFNPETQIKYALPISENNQRATLVVYNQLGQKIKTLVNEVKPSGRYEVTWNGLNDNGQVAASGIYYYQLKYGKHISTKKMVLLR